MLHENFNQTNSKLCDFYNYSQWELRITNAETKFPVRNVNICIWVTIQLKFAGGEQDRKKIHIMRVLTVGNLSLEGFIWKNHHRNIHQEINFELGQIYETNSPLLSCNGEHRGPGEGWDMLMWMLGAENPACGCSTCTNDDETYEHWNLC